MLLSIQQPFANQVDIYLGVLPPDFSDRSGIWARQLTSLHAISPTDQEGSDRLPQHDENQTVGMPGEMAIGWDKSC